MTSFRLALSVTAALFALLPAGFAQAQNAPADSGREGVTRPAPEGREGVTRPAPGHAHDEGEAAPGGRSAAPS